MSNRKVYKLGDINRYMKLQIDFPDYLNRMLKIEKERHNLKYLREVVIKIVIKNKKSCLNPANPN